MINIQHLNTTQKHTGACAYTHHIESQSSWLWLRPNPSASSVPASGRSPLLCRRQRVCHAAQREAHMLVRNMSLSLSLNIYIYIYIYIFIHAHIHIYIYMYTHMCISLSLSIYIYIRSHIDMYVSLSLSLYIYLDSRASQGASPPRGRVQQAGAGAPAPGHAKQTHTQR